MPAARRGKAAEDEEPEDEATTEEENGEEPDLDEDEDLEDEAAEEFEQSKPGTSIQVDEDAIHVSVPRDGNEKSTMKAIADFVDKLA